MSNKERSSIYDTRSIFSLNRIKFILDHKLLPRPPTMAFSSVRENVNHNTQVEMCWKMLSFINYFIYFKKLLYLYFIYFIIVTVVIVIFSRCYVLFFDGNEPIIFLKLLTMFNCVDVTDGIVTRSDVVDQLFTVLLFKMARCYGINFSMCS